MRFAIAWLLPVSLVALSLAAPLGCAGGQNATNAANAPDAQDAGSPVGPEPDSSTTRVSGEAHDSASNTDAPGAEDAGDAADAGDAVALFAAPNGSGAACTMAAPCSLSGAQAKVRTLNHGMTADIVVSLRGGTYPLTAPLSLDPSDSGDSGHRVVYQAYPNETPVLSGATKITGFQLFDSGKQIWRAPVAPAVDSRQLFVNGLRAERPHTARGSMAFTPTARGLATIAATSLLSWAVRPGLEVAMDNSWKHMRCPITGIEVTGSTPALPSHTAPSTTGTTLVIDPACWTNNMLQIPNPGYPFNGSGLPGLEGVSTVENVFELLAQPGQFYLDTKDHYLYYIPRTGENMATADVELPILETLVTIAGTPGHIAPVNDDESHVTYAANWSAQPQRGLGDLGNDVHATQGAGAAVFTFTGTGVDLLAETNSDEGDIDVTVRLASNGAIVKTATVSALAATRLSQQVLFSISELPKDTYQLAINKHTADTSWAIVDAFVVTSDVIAPVHDVAFRGISFAYATWMAPSKSGYVDNQAGVLWDPVTHAPIRIPGAFTVHRGKRIDISGNTFTHLGGAGIELADGTQDTTVVGNRVEDTSGGGVLAGEVDDYYLNDVMPSGPARMTSGIVLSNNAVTNTGIEYHDVTSIWVGVSRTTTVAHNLVAHTSYTGISLGWGWGWVAECPQQLASNSPSCRRGTTYAGGNQILNNRIYDVMRTLYDGGPIYTLGGQSTVGSIAPTVAGNVVSDAAACSDMLYHDEGSTYWQTYGNFAYNSACRWLGIWAATEHDIRAGVPSPNYTENPSPAQVGGSNNAIAQPVVVPFDAWNPAVTTIVNQAGLEPAYAALEAKTSIVNDADAVIRYSADAQGPQWGVQTFRGFGDMNDDAHFTSIDGAAATLTFTGTGIDVLAEKNSDQGGVEIVVDGVSKGTVDTSLPGGTPRQTQQVVYGIHGLASAAHTIVVIKRSGQYALIDGYRVDQPISPATGAP
jgi:hypothetical protein